MTQQRDDFINSWQQIINDVEKSDIPLECIKKIIIKSTEGRKTINIETLRKQGLDIEEIEKVVNRIFSQYEGEINYDFVLDVNSVAKIVQPETDKLLGKL